MATLQKIFVQDFRNITFAELEFSPSVNCICGLNGQGKTNLLDAVHYLSMTKSAFGAADSFCIRYGCDSFSISGTYAMQDGLKSVFSVHADKNGKTLKRDGKTYPRVSSHIGVLPVVMVSPGDSSLVSESGDERRRFANAVLSQLDAEYLAALQTYNRLLAQRNKMLKETAPDVSLLSVLDMQMDSAAAYIVKARLEFTSKLSKAVSYYYNLLSGGREAVSVSFKSDIIADDGSLLSLSSILESRRDRDLYLKYTSAGIQRDDFVFDMDGHPIRRCGSQGQQKSFLVALKLAQYDIMKQQYGYPPLMLLDDVFDKLDVNRISNLLKIVSTEDYGQIFISDTNLERMKDIIGGIADDAAYFITENGEFQACSRA